MAVKIDRVEYGEVWAVHRNVPGPNSRLFEHEHEIPVRVTRITLSDGRSGWGFAYRNQPLGEALLGKTLDEAWDATTCEIREDWHDIQTPFWDLLSRDAGLSVAEFATRGRGWPAPRPRVETYDSTLLFDEFHIDDDAEAVAFIVDEALDGYGLGHRSFKVKIGRGAMHMPLQKGLKRDIDVTNAVRAALGPDVKIMIDANDGYNFNLAKDLLRETGGSDIFWAEELFREDDVLHQTLKTWMADEGLSVMIADGEYNAPSEFVDWAKAGFVDVVQFDLQRYGFSRWLRLGPELAEVGAKAAPHHWGTWFNNYAGAQIAAAMPSVLTVEWDTATCDAINDSGYRIEDGHIVLPEAPGWGLDLDEAAFRSAVAENGYDLRAR